MPALRETRVAAERRPRELLPADRVRRGPASAQRPNGALVAVLPWRLFKGRAEGWGFINLCFRQNSWRCGSVRCPVNAKLEFLSRCVQRGKGGGFAKATVGLQELPEQRPKPAGFLQVSGQQCSQLAEPELATAAPVPSEFLSPGP